MLHGVPVESKIEVFFCSCQFFAFLASAFCIFEYAFPHFHIPQKLPLR